MSDEEAAAIQHLADCQGPCMDGKSLRIVRGILSDRDSLRTERDEAEGNAVKWQAAAEALGHASDALLVDRDSLRAALERIAKGETSGSWPVTHSCTHIARQALTSSEKESE